MAESRGAQLMKKMAAHYEEDAGSNLGGDAGLSQIGPPPSASPVINMLRNAKKSRTLPESGLECPDCNMVAEDENSETCLGCGSSLVNSSKRNSALSFSERFEQARGRITLNEKSTVVRDPLLEEISFRITELKGKFESLCSLVEQLKQ